MPLERIAVAAHYCAGNRDAVFEVALRGIGDCSFELILMAIKATGIPQVYSIFLFGQENRPSISGV